ncbi:rhomboid family intramembrane serine protease [Thalassiella azotivora]
MTGPDPAAAPGVPYCPRHPGRESYVRCQRCERPVCPECQRQAAVGVQCVDCVRDAARSAPRTVTALGGRQHDGRPVVTWSIMGLCVVAYLAQLVVPGFTERFMLVPAWSSAEPWRLLTSAFLHSDGWPLHILFNLYAVYLLGPYLEELLGRTRFLVTYLLSALGGSAAFVLIAGSVQSGPGGPFLTSAVGASGAVFGLFGALVVVQRRLGRRLGQIAVVLGLNLVLGFVVPRIAWEAHLGGLLVGVACAAALAYVPAGPRRRVLQVAGLVVVGVLVAAATVVGLAYAPQFAH